MKSQDQLRQELSRCRKNVKRLKEKIKQLEKPSWPDGKTTRKCGYCGGEFLTLEPGSHICRQRR